MLTQPHVAEPFKQQPPLVAVPFGARDGVLPVRFAKLHPIMVVPPGGSEAEIDRRESWLFWR
jgi:hypothetical protein